MKYIKLWIALSFMFCIKPLAAQNCGSCSVSIDSTSSSAYTVSAGQTFCIDTTGNFIGSIVLNGGTVCNKGVFEPQSLTLISGDIYNYSIFKCDTSLALGTAINLYCETQSFTNINGAFTISGSYTNKGITNVSDSLSYAAGTFNNSGIINCRLLLELISGITNSGIINKD